MKYTEKNIQDYTDDELSEMLTNIVNEREGISDNNKKAEYLDELYLNIDSEIMKRKIQRMWQCNLDASVNYPIEEQLKDIANTYGYTLPKDPYDMDEEELFIQEQIAERYVRWTYDENTIQDIPVDRKTGKKIA